MAERRRNWIRDFHSTFWTLTFGNPHHQSMNLFWKSTGKRSCQSKAQHVMTKYMMTMSTGAKGKQITRENYTTEDSMFLYVVSLLEYLAPTSVRSRYSMVKSEILVHDNVNSLRNSCRIKKKYAKKPLLPMTTIYSEICLLG